MQLTSAKRIRRGAAVLIVLLGLGAIVAPTAGAAVGDIDRFAGTYASGFSGDGGAASAAQLNQPTGVARDGAGRTYIADRENNRVRVVGADGLISTLVADLFRPVDVAVDVAGDLLYIAEEVDPFVNRIQRVDLSAAVPTPVVIAGGGSSGYGGDGGPATGAVFKQLGGIGVGPDGDVFIADKGNNRIRRIDVSTDSISLVAGTGAAGGDNGDALTVATFATPKNVAVSPDGTTAYVADEGTNNIRAIDLGAGVVSVFAGSYAAGFAGDGGAATSATLNSPDGVTVAPNGDVYIADTSSNRVRRVAGGTITTVAGTGVCCASGDGGAATSAQVGNPTGVVVDAAGWMWIAAPVESAVRVVEGAVVPSAPLALAAVRATTGVVLTWDPPADDGGAPVLEYVIYRGGVEIGRAALLTFTDAAPPDAATQYSVAARNVAGIGPASAVVEVAAVATTQPTTPITPTPAPAAQPTTAAPTFVG